MERHRVYHTLKTCTANADLPRRELTCLPRTDKDHWTIRYLEYMWGCFELYIPRGKGSGHTHLWQQSSDHRHVVQNCQSNKIKW